MNKLMLIPALRTIAVRKIEKTARNLFVFASKLKNVDLLSSFEKTILAENIKFKAIHKGQRAFVIVNGPSLKYQDLSFLKNEITFTASSFWKHPIVNEWQPTYQ